MLKTKMKKCDPEDFSIHDFLPECKTSESADSRFEDDDDARDQLRHPELIFVNKVGVASNLKPLYEQVSALLTARGWKKKRGDTGRFHLIFGGPRGVGIPFKRFSQLFKWDYGITPHCNFFRGFVWLEKQEKLVQMLRAYAQTTPGALALLPQSYLFFPACHADCELDTFRQEFESREKRGLDNVWMLKPSDPGKASKARITRAYREIEEHLLGLEKTAEPWVVQKYISAPLLLPDGRKWDFRIFVLLDKDLSAFWCPEPFCRTCSEEYDSDLSNTIAHLSGTSVQRKSKRFGRKEAGNALGAEFMAKWFAEERISLEAAIDSAQQIITTTVAATQKQMEDVQHADYTGFQVLAFDFLMREDETVFLNRVKSNPAIPAHIVEDFAQEVVELLILPRFEDDHSSKQRLFEALPPARTSRNNHK